jgi:hypothetical protein
VKARARTDRVSEPLPGRHDQRQPADDQRGRALRPADRRRCPARPSAMAPSRTSSRASTSRATTRHSRGATSCRASA